MLIVAALLVVQGLVAFVPGRVLCVPVLDCGRSECHSRRHADVARHEHHDHRAFEGEITDGSCVRHAHQHDCHHDSSNALETSLRAVAWHPSDDCGCHIHIPLPGDEQMLCSPRAESTHSRVFFTPEALYVVFADRCEPLPRTRVLSHPPDLGTGAPLRALRTTRLII